MTSVTDNVIKNIGDEGCVSFCACNRTWIDSADRFSAFEVLDDNCAI